MNDRRQELILAIAKGEKLGATDILDDVSARQLSVLIGHLKDELIALHAVIDRKG